MSKERSVTKTIAKTAATIAAIAAVAAGSYFGWKHFHEQELSDVVEDIVDPVEEAA